MSFSSSNSSPQSLPAWYFLLGLLCGHVLTLRDSLPRALEAWQSIVNSLLVPIYSMAVVLYLAARTWSKMEQDKRRRKQHEAQKQPSPPPPVAPSAIITPVPSSAEDEQRVNMNGSFKLVKNNNFDGFLAAQGIPWALRRAADKARPTHSFTHSGNTITIKITGIIESQTTYEIGGPPMETNIRGRTFVDTLEYLETNDGIRSNKKAISEDYDIQVERKLAADRMSLTMTSKAIFHGDREDVVCIQQFDRVA